MKQQIMDLLNNRVSLRRYEDKPISREDLDFILKGAMRAPTAGNMQLYSIIKVEDPQLKLQLSQSCDNQPFIAKAPTLLIFCADFQKLYDYFKVTGVAQRLEKDGKTMWHPKEGDFLLAVTDAIIASAFANIAAEAVNVGSCYIGDITEHYEIHQQLLNLPQYVMPVGMLTLGYYPANVNRTPKERFDSEFVVFDEQYDRLNEEQLKAMYASREENFNQANKFGAENFGQHMYFRKFDTDFIKEMTRSAKVMMKTWSSFEAD